MGISIVRFMDDRDRKRWGVLKDKNLIPIEGEWATLSSFLLQGGKSQAESANGSPISIKSIELLSPVTAPCQIICQGKNYLDHVIETGVDPKNKDFNLLFTKADSALAGSRGKVSRPPGVRLLDYELELGLVIGKEIRGSERITEENLSEFVAGFVMANDISARDIQIPERQWFKGKSFRGFCPVGPFLFLPDPDEFSCLNDLNLELKVNEEIRQKANTKQLLYRPGETLAEISRIFDLRPGDLLLTGTPGGVAMKVKKDSGGDEKFSSDREKFNSFIDQQSASGRYLKDGDIIKSSIRSSDGQIDLGEQLLKIAPAEN